MPSDHVELLREVQQTLQSQDRNSEAFELILAQLGSLVAQSSQTEQVRLSLVSNPDISTSLLEIINDSNVKDFGQYKLRIFRGSILLIRNLASTGILPKSVFIAALLSSLGSATQVEETGTIKTQLVVSYVQALANLSANVGELNIDFKLLLNVTELTINPPDDKLVELPIAIFLNNLFNNENLFTLLNDDHASSGILEWLVKRFEEMDTDNELNDSEKVLVTFAQSVVSHESYNKWLHSQYDRHDEASDFARVMQFNQIIVTSKEEWDSFQSAAILAWAFDLFKIFSALAQEMLPQPVEDIDERQLEVIHSNLVSILDCISDMGKLNSARQFLEHYNAIEALILLLRVVHQNVERKTLKKVEEINSNGKKKTKEFPQIKSLIIEIISYLCHESFTMQEKVREYHGLELVLSNCMIDDNDPYIKERAIICIKILLDKNPKNQQFVAELEAEQTVDDEALREVGYEVEIDNGQVKLRKAEK